MAGAFPAPLSYAEMTSLADGVLRLDGRLRDLFFKVIEETDMAVLADSSKAISDKVEDKEKPAEKK